MYMYAHDNSQVTKEAATQVCKYVAIYLQALASSFILRMCYIYLSYAWLYTSLYVRKLHICICMAYIILYSYIATYTKNQLIVIV